MIGERIAGKYRVEGVLGEGGMGSVYRARMIRDARPVAIKMLRDEIVGQDQFESRFALEISITAKCKHENIVEVLDHGTLEDGRKYLVIELLSGRNLGEILETCHGLEWRRALRITREVALALGEVHSHGIVHRDIKPENIFLLPKSGGEMVKLMDFGLAKNIGSDKLDNELTQPGFAIGTPTYMAPERVTGDYDHRSDLYGLAVVAYQMFAGKPPFEGAPTEVLRDHMLKEPPAISQVNVRAVIPRGVELILRKALSKKMEDRYQSAAELVKELDMVLVGEDDSTILTSKAPAWCWQERWLHFFSSIPMFVRWYFAAGVLVTALLLYLFLTGSPSLEKVAADKKTVAESSLVDSSVGDAPPDKVYAFDALAGTSRVSEEEEAQQSALAEILMSRGFILNQRGVERSVPLAESCKVYVQGGIQVHLCFMKNEEGLNSGRRKLEEEGGEATSIVLSDNRLLLWVLDRDNEDPEGHGLQELLYALSEEMGEGNEEG